MDIIWTSFQKTSCQKPLWILAEDSTQRSVWVDYEELFTCKLERRWNPTYAGRIRLVGSLLSAGATYSKPPPGTQGNVWNAPGFCASPSY